jgi:hypothetical protein
MSTRCIQKSRHKKAPAPPGSQTPGTTPASSHNSTAVSLNSTNPFDIPDTPPTPRTSKVCLYVALTICPPKNRPRDISTPTICPSNKPSALTTQEHSYNCTIRPGIFRPPWVRGRLVTHIMTSTLSKMSCDIMSSIV